MGALSKPQEKSRSVVEGLEGLEELLRFLRLPQPGTPKP